MGGSSGGSGGPRFGSSGGGSAADPCDIRAVTTLQSTKPTTLRAWKVGDELAVILYPDARSRTVGCVNPDTGALVGTISMAAQAALIRCLLAEAVYTAKIVLLDGGRCDVQIRRT